MVLINTIPRLPKAIGSIQNNYNNCIMVIGYMRAWGEETQTGILGNRKFVFWGHLVQLWFQYAGDDFHARVRWKYFGHVYFLLFAPTLIE